MKFCTVFSKKNCTDFLAVPPVDWTMFSECV